MGQSPLQRGERRRTLPCALVVIGALSLGGCGSGGGSVATAHPSFAAYRQCLANHGVTPRPPGEPRGRNAHRIAVFGAARRACADLRPAGGLRFGRITSEAKTAFRTCLRNHGVTLPARAAGPAASRPAAGGTIERGGMLGGLDRNDPAVAAALAACRSLLLARPPASPTTGPG